MKKNKFWVPTDRNLKKLLMTMKLTLLILLLSTASILASSVYSQNTTLSIHVKNCTMKELIEEIENQSEFIFVYYDDVVDLDRRITVNITDKTIDKILDQVFKTTNNTYLIYDRQITIGLKDILSNVKNDNKLSLEAEKNIKLTGKVTDSKGEPIPGATIIVKGKTIGTITNFDGFFNLDVPENSEFLIFSFVGFTSQEVAIHNQTSFNIQLKEETTGLDEVVVVGYGTQTKASVVGAISTVKSDEIKSIATSNLTNTIGGHVSGIITKMGEGKPGDDDAQIYIRGRATTNSTAPLVLVDGIESEFGRINPNDIESFSVLKDASATAVYGVRGANGVILITTKRGNKGKPKIEVSSQLRVHKIIKYPKLLNSYDFARLYNEAYLNAGNTSKYYSDEDLAAYRDHTDPYGHPDVNWFKALTKPFFLEHRHDISIKGGTSKVKYYVSGEIVSQDGAYKQWDDMKYNTNATYDRLNLRMNFDFRVTKTTDLTLNFSNRVENTNDVVSDVIGEVSNRVGLWDEIINHPPNAGPLLNPDGSFGYLSSGTGDNPYVTLKQGGFQKGRTNFIQGSFKLNQKLDFITKGLSFRFMGGLNTTSLYTYKLVESPATWYYNSDNESYTQITRPNLPTVSVGDDYINQLYHFETALDYSRTFNEVHNVTALLLYNQDRRIINANAPVNHLGGAGRVTYGFKNKYLGEINFGYNGSDQFQKGQRFAFLPAASLGWVVSEENFWKEKVPFVKYLKLRGSYGTAGNDKLGSFSYLYKSVYNRSTSYLYDGYYFGSTASPVAGIYEGSLGNDKVTWEIAHKQNYGIDFNLFSQDLAFSIDYFNEKRSNILAQRNTITEVFGVPANSLPPENIGKVENKGFEFEVRYNKKMGDWQLSLNSNISYAKNKIIDIDEVKQVYDYMNKTGKSIGQYFGYLWTGEFYSYEELGYVWNEAAEGANKYILPEGAVASIPVPTDNVRPGELKFVDRNGDGVIDSYDSGAIGKSTTPEMIYGLNIGIRYKRFSFQMFWQGAGGFSVNYGNTPLQTEFKNGGPAHEMHLGRWAYFPEYGIDTRETATYPILMFDSAPQSQKNSSFKVYDCSYIRLKNIEFSYLLPNSVVNPLHMEFAKIFITGNNLLTIDNIGFLDPEAPGSQAAYPQSLFIGAGINIGF